MKLTIENLKKKPALFVFMDAPVITYPNGDIMMCGDHGNWVMSAWSNTVKNETDLEDFMRHRQFICWI